MMAYGSAAPQNRAMEPVTLTTRRLLLRTVGPQDTDTVYAACQDPDIQRWTTIPSPYLTEHARSFTRQLVPDGWASGSMFTFGVFGPEGDLTGMIGLTRHPLNTAEIGFWAVRAHRGRGYTSEAVGAVTRWAFGELSLDRIEWRAEVGNQPSRKVAERAGFTFEGTLRSAITNAGTRRDCWLASLLPSDLNLPSPSPYLPPKSPAGPSGA
jgi:RimJ/RimL family protein N-acetyltransferase